MMSHKSRIKRLISSFCWQLLAIRIFMGLIPTFPGQIWLNLLFSVESPTFARPTAVHSRPRPKPGTCAPSHSSARSSATMRPPLVVAPQPRHDGDACHPGKPVVSWGENMRDLPCKEDLRKGHQIYPDMKYLLWTKHTWIHIYIYIKHVCICLYILCVCVQDLSDWFSSCFPPIISSSSIPIHSLVLDQFILNGIVVVSKIGEWDYGL